MASPQTRQTRRPCFQGAAVAARRTGSPFPSPMPRPRPAKWHNHYTNSAWPDKGGRDREWRHCLRRRSQRHRLTWQRMMRIADHWLPRPKLRHPYPDGRLDVMTRGRSPVRSFRSPGSVRGAASNRRPYWGWLDFKDLRHNAFGGCCLENSGTAVAVAETGGSRRAATPTSWCAGSSSPRCRCLWHHLEHPLTAPSHIKAAQHTSKPAPKPYFMLPRSR